MGETRAEREARRVAEEARRLAEQQRQLRAEAWEALRGALPEYQEAVARALGRVPALELPEVAPYITPTVEAIRAWRPVPMEDMYRRYGMYQPTALEMALGRVEAFRPLALRPEFAITGLERARRAVEAITPRPVEVTRGEAMLQALGARDAVAERFRGIVPEMLALRRDTIPEELRRISAGEGLDVQQNPFLQAVAQDIQDVVEEQMAGETARIQAQYGEMIGTPLMQAERAIAERGARQTARALTQMYARAYEQERSNQMRALQVITGVQEAQVRDALAMARNIAGADTELTYNIAQRLMESELRRRGMEMQDARNYATQMIQLAETGRALDALRFQVGAEAGREQLEALGLGIRGAQALGVQQLQALAGGAELARALGTMGWGQLQALQQLGQWQYLQDLARQRLLQEEAWRQFQAQQQLAGIPIQPYLAMLGALPTGYPPRFVPPTPLWAQLTMAGMGLLGETAPEIRRGVTALVGGGA